MRFQRIASYGLLALAIGLEGGEVGGAQYLVTKVDLPDSDSQSTDQILVDHIHTWDSLPPEGSTTVALIGTDQGLFSLDNSGKAQEILAGPVTFLQLLGQDVLIGTGAAGLYLYSRSDPNWRRPRLQTTFRNRRIVAAEQTTVNGRTSLWVATSSALYSVRLDQGTAKLVYSATCPIRDIHASRERVLLIGTLCGLEIYSSDDESIVPVEPKIQIAQISALDDDGVEVALITENSKSQPSALYRADLSNLSKGVFLDDATCELQEDLAPCRVSLVKREMGRVLIGRQDGLILRGEHGAVPLGQFSDGLEFPAALLALDRERILVGGSGGMSLFSGQVDQGYTNRENQENILGSWPNVRSFAFEPEKNDRIVFFGTNRGLYRLFLDCLVEISLSGVPWPDRDSRLTFGDAFRVKVDSSGSCPADFDQRMEPARVSFQPGGGVWSEPEEWRTAEYRPMTQSAPGLYRLSIKLIQPGGAFSVRHVRVKRFGWVEKSVAFVLSNAEMSIALVVGIVVAWKQGGLAKALEWSLLKWRIYELIPKSAVAFIGRWSQRKRLGRELSRFATRSEARWKVVSGVLEAVKKELRPGGLREIQVVVPEIAIEGIAKKIELAVFRDLRRLPFIVEVPGSSSADSWLSSHGDENYAEIVFGRTDLVLVVEFSGAASEVPPLLFSERVLEDRSCAVWVVSKPFVGIPVVWPADGGSS